MFPLIKLAKKLKDIARRCRYGVYAEFPLIKLAKKLKVCRTLWLRPDPNFLFPLIKLAKKLKVL